MSKDLLEQLIEDIKVSKANNALREVTYGLYWDLKNELTSVYKEWCELCDADDRQYIERRRKAIDDLAVPMTIRQEMHYSLCSDTVHPLNMSRVEFKRSIDALVQEDLSPFVPERIIENTASMSRMLNILRAWIKTLKYSGDESGFSVLAKLLGGRLLYGLHQVNGQFEIYLKEYEDRLKKLNIKIGACSLGPKRDKLILLREEFTEKFHEKKKMKATKVEQHRRNVDRKIETINRERNFQLIYVYAEAIASEVL